MDLRKTIQDLYAEKEKLGACNCSPWRNFSGSRLKFPGNGRAKRRGRKSMGSDERQEVSEHMKKYWAGRQSRPDAERRAGIKRGHRRYLLS